MRSVIPIGQSKEYVNNIAPDGPRECLSCARTRPSDARDASVMPCGPEDEHARPWRSNLTRAWVVFNWQTAHKQEEGGRRRRSRRNLEYTYLSIHVYIYLSIYLSLSLSIYIYIYIYISGSRLRRAQRSSTCRMLAPLRRSACPQPEGLVRCWVLSEFAGCLTHSCL